MRATFLKVFLSLAAASAPCYAYAYDLGGFKIMPTASISEEYDDNITYASTNTKQDAITNLKVGLEARSETKTRSLRFSVNVAHQFFAKHNNYDNTAEDASLDYQKELSKFDRISFRDDFLHAQDPRSFEDEFGRTGGRYSYLRNRFNFGYARDITRQLTMTLSYYNELTAYSKADKENTDLNLAGVEAAYALNSKNILYLLGNYGHRQFKHADSIQSERVAAGMRHYFTEQLYLDGRGGWDFIQSSRENSDGQFISASLINDIDPTTRFSLTYLQQYSTTNDTDDIFKSWRIQANLIKQVFKRLLVNLSGFYGKGKYESLAAEDDLQGASAGLTYDLTQRIKLNLNYAYSKTSSNVSSREYTKNRIFLGASLYF